MNTKSRQQVKSLLDQQYERYHALEFIQNDPIGVVHQLQKPQDIEIMGFWIAMLAWGQRKTIINKGQELLRLMDGTPHDFIKHHKETDRKRFLNFKHRTFQATDTLYFLEFLQYHYQRHDTLESAFFPSHIKDIKGALRHFHNYFFSLPDAPQRTRKHISTPERNSACKRLNMFLRWMVRKDDKQIDFGLWDNIGASQLMIPLDVHVMRVANKLKLITTDKSSWKAVEELTAALRLLDPKDPVKYDYALFSMGVHGTAWSIEG